MHGHGWRSIFLLIVVGLAPLVQGATNESDFRSGAARRDITPQQPVPMWGYGARRDALSTGALDALHATALVLQAGTQKVAIVGLDLGRSPSEKSLQVIRQRIHERAGIGHSFMAGSHTHHGPVLELSDASGKGQGKFDAALEYYRQLEDAVTAAVLEANQKLVPATLAAGSLALEGFNRNRHTKLEPKPSDRNLGVLRLDDAATGKPLAILVNWAAHPTMVPGSTLKFSADYAGAMREKIEQELGGLALFMQGASGDQSVNAGEHQGHVAYGTALGAEVVKLAASLKPAVPARSSLLVREERFKFESRVDLNNPLTRMAYSLAFFPELVANFADEYTEGVRPRLTVAVLNAEIGLVGLSGEVFSQHAIRLRERARVPHLFFFSCNNGYHQYFPTIEAVAEGGYGADAAVAPAAVGAGEQLMNHALQWLYQLRGKLK